MQQDEKVLQRIEVFKRDLVKLEPRYMVRKFVTLGEPYVIDHEKYFHIRSEISDQFDVHATEVVMVGSGKLGFSIKPSHEYRHFDKDLSDIDIAIVSSQLFESIWKGVLEYYSSTGYWSQHKEFKDYLFKGWIRPDKLPKSPQFRKILDWWGYMDILTNKMNMPRLKAGLYKSWYHFEMYQMKTVRNCRQLLEVGNG